MSRALPRSFRLRLALLVAIAAALAAALLVVTRHDAGPRPTLAELAATNYRTLSPKESRALLHFAQAEYRCLSRHGLEITAPVASRNRITMHAPGQAAGALVEAMRPCIPIVGPPPPKSSLQARSQLVLVYVPKRCLMDPSTLGQT